VHTVADKIRAFYSAEGDWRPLDVLFTELFSRTCSQDEIDAVFSLFERYPDEDGAGVFWSAIHGLEVVGSYDERLRTSLRTAPSESAIILAIRIVNSGDASFVPIITEVASRPDSPNSVRSMAHHFLAKTTEG
jgi:hypothetical protein